MRMVDRIKDWYFEGSAKRFGRSCARTMLFSVRVALNAHKGPTQTYAWFAARALSTRSGWEQRGEESGWLTFWYEKTGAVVLITDNMSVLDVTHQVIDAELTPLLRDIFPLERRA